MDWNIILVIVSIITLIISIITSITLILTYWNSPKPCLLCSTLHYNRRRRRSMLKKKNSWKLCSFSCWEFWEKENMKSHYKQGCYTRVERDKEKLEKNYENLIWKGKSKRIKNNFKDFCFVIKILDCNNVNLINY